MGCKFQLITLAVFPTLNYSTFQLAEGDRHRATEGCAKLLGPEFVAEKHGYSASRHQQEVGTGYVDDVAQVIAASLCSATTLRGSTEREQCH